MPDIYHLEIQSPPPPGYPQETVKDTFATTPFTESYAGRRKALLSYYAGIPASGFKAPFHELARLASGRDPYLGVFEATLDYIDARLDCADFLLHAILRLLYQFSHLEKISLTPDLLARARRTVLGFKYGPEEPGDDSMCTWTENHQILFNAGAYLAGQRFPETTFANSGQNGQQKMEIARARILRWLDLRFRTGFSEWLSNVYYDEDLTALANLVDFCQDEEIRQRAAIVMDLILYDMALNSFKGVFGSTHGRSYEDNKKWAASEATTGVQKLLFGTGVYTAGDNMSAVLLALSSHYRLPQAIYAVANDSQHEMANRQRMGIRLEEAKRWGLGFDNFEDGMVFLSMEAYTHPSTINLVMRMFDAYRWWNNSFFEPFAQHRRLIQTMRRLGLLPALARLFERDLTRNLRSEANLYTYRTPDYMLSSALDYRKGYGGDQQHIWQATLGPDAVCFTTHPARRSGPSPNYWTGSGSLPRVVQIENVVIAIYNVRTGPALYVPDRLFFTHAWLPQDQFDQVVERGGWIFARLGDAYLALRSQHTYQWQKEPGEVIPREVLAPGRQNVWVCELGRRADDGDFSDFTERISLAKIDFGRLSLSYHSPSQGHLTFNWNEPLRQNGNLIPLQNFPRYGNLYTQAPFNSEQISIECRGERLDLDWKDARRDASSFVE